MNHSSSATPLRVALIVALVVIAAFAFLYSNTKSVATVSLVEIQQANSQSDLFNNDLKVQGTVSSIYRERDSLGGFFVQQQDPKSGSIGGIFVSDLTHSVEVGDQVQIHGRVSESRGLLTFGAANSGDPIELKTLGSSETVKPVEILGSLHEIDWETYEGVLVQFPGRLFVVDHYNLARYGQLTLARDMLQVPTNQMDPDGDEAASSTSKTVNGVDAIRAQQQNNRQGVVIVDDGINAQNRFPIPLIPELGTEIPTLRRGAVINDLQGVVYEDDGKYYVLATKPLSFNHQERPSRPRLDDANLTVASFNLLNYFTTIDDGSNGARGSDSAVEFQRQRQKIVAAILALDADIVGLMELENNLESEKDLVDSLNQMSGKHVFAGCGIPEGFSEAPGADNAIRVGLIYRRDRVRPTQPIQLVSDSAFWNARTPLVQQFSLLDGQDQLTVIVNHFKSKGAGKAKGNDLDQDDGQGPYNESRTKQATALIKYIDSLARPADPKVLIIGDLNSYCQEDPIDVLRAGGLNDLSKLGSDAHPYSYVYFGQQGCLDHAFATDALAESAVGMKVWHINSDEPRFLDYNVEYNPRPLFRPDPFRSSDHDPVVIGFDFK